ncbi:MAG TPA: amidohydrolase family protein [Myxococcota bacterium]|nr:amidohydrolase family protein [Myxococcota bacterium]
MALALSGLRIWDGVSETLRPGAGELFAEAGRWVASAPRDAERIDLRGAVALPGLCDAHVHLALDPERREVAQDGSADSLQAMAARARRMAEAGITTARDLGGPDFRALELRDRIACGEEIGPRLLCAGQPLTSPKGHCWYWGAEARGPDELRAGVRRQVEAGADWIKVMATGGVLTKGTTPATSQFDQEELDAAVAEARAHGRRTAAHCHGTEGIQRAARAGVRTIEHCSFASESAFGGAPDPEVIDFVARSGAWISPTVNTGFARFFDERGEPSKFALRMSEVYRRLRAAGARFVASTDAGIPNVAHHRLPEALPIFARLAGLTPVETLRTATSGAAQALGLGRETGQIAPGFAADLLVVDGNPLEDLGALLRPVLVLLRGRVALKEGS